MSLIVKSSSKDVISLPDWLMDTLNLHEGDEVKTTIEGQTLRITSLDHFLALRGTLEDDQEFDTAIEFLNQAWKEWTEPNSA